MACGLAKNGIATLDDRAVYAVFASLCLYSAGLLLNDIFDIAEDRRDRPHRPLASGNIRLQTAWIVAVILSAVGILLMTVVADRTGLLISALLLGCIVIYNGFMKRIAVLGAINMGLCRAFSFLLGVVAFSGSLDLPPLVLLCAIILTAYIGAVTNLARYETEKSAPVFPRLLPGLVLILAFLRFSTGYGSLFQQRATMLIAVALILAAAEIGLLFRKNSPPLPATIGALIRVLLPIQAAFCMIYDRTNHAFFTALALLLCLPISRIVSRKFYAS